MIETEAWTAESTAAEDETPVEWEALYNELGERVFRLLHRMLGDPEEASDVAHDAFVRIHQERFQFARRGPLHAWAFRVAANLGRDALRRRRAQQRYEQTRAGGRRETLSAGRRDVERLSLSRALARLDASHRAVLLLHDVDGYSHREIAEMLAIAVGTSKGRLSRARSTMRSALAGRPGARVPRERRGPSHQNPSENPGEGPEGGRE